MATGYTDMIGKGATFEEFAISCARAFGACISMRDEPLDSPIPERFEPSDYHERKTREAKSTLKRLQGMSLVDAEKIAKREYAEQVERRIEMIEEKRVLEEKYKAILERVREWQPPTPDHEGLKEFMMSQVTQSIDWDCCIYGDEPVELTGEEWLVKETLKAQRDLEYHKKEHKEEVDRVNGRNQWISDLRDSLAQASADNGGQ